MILIEISCKILLNHKLLYNWVLSIVLSVQDNFTLSLRLSSLIKKSFVFLSLSLSKFQQEKCLKRASKAHYQLTNCPSSMPMTSKFSACDFTWSSTSAGIAASVCLQNINTLSFTQVRLETDHNFPPFTNLASIKYHRCNKCLVQLHVF